MDLKGKLVKKRGGLKKWWKRTQKDYVKIRYDLGFYLFAKRQNAQVRIRRNLKKNSTFYYTSCYFVIATLVSAFSQLWFSNLSAGTVFNFYISAGAMAGGTLAIIFSFNALLVNFTLNQYPPEFFHLSGYDKTQDKIYFLITTIAMSLFVMGFMYRDTSYDWEYWLRFVGLLVVFALFYLIFLSYCLIRRRLNPVASFGFIVGPAFDLLNKSEKEAQRIAGMLRKNPSLKPDEAYTADYQPHILLQSRYEELARFIGYLYDYHDKLVEKKDYSSALSVLDAIGSIIIRFVDFRKNSFILMPSAEYLLVSVTDSQTFFDTNFQRLTDRGKTYIKLSNQDGSRKVIELFQGIGLKLRELSFPKLERENPPFAQCIHYLGDLCDTAIKENDLEATFQAARAYAWLGAAAVNKNYDTQSSIYDSLLKLAMYAGVQKQTVVMEKVAQAFSTCAEAFPKTRRGAQSIEFKIFMDKLEEFIWYYTALTNTANDYQANITGNTLGPLKVLNIWLEQLAREGSNNRNPERRSAQRDMIELADRIRRLMRKLSDRDKITVANRYLGVQLTEIACDAAGLLLSNAHKNGWQRNSNEVINGARWLVGQVAFFTNNAPNDLTSSILDSMSDKVTNVSLYAIHKGDSEVAKAGAYANYDLAITCMNKVSRSQDYESARIMANTGILAVLALQKQDTEVLKECKELANKFNAAYKQKFFPNGLGINPQGRGYIGSSPQQLNTELRRIGGNISGPRFIHDTMEYPEKYLLKLAPQTQAEHFDTIIRYFKS